MTRTEFIEDICSWSELIDFCNSEGIYDCDDIYSRDDRDDKICDDVRELLEYHDWTAVKRNLSDIDDYDYDYYRRDGDFDWVGMDDEDLGYYKQDILDRYDAEGLWDEEDEVEDDEVDANDETIEEGASEDVDFSFSEFFEACSAEFKTVSEIVGKAECASQEAFATFITGG